MAVPVPPKLPWKKGDQGSYSAVVVEVHVCKDDRSRVFSMHQLQDSRDRDIVLKWPSGGQEQVAHALLTETLRREAMLEALIRITKEPAFPMKLVHMSDDERRKVEAEMVGHLKTQINAVMDRLAEAVVQEALREIAAGL